MADYNSGLPVRSQADGSDERLHVKIVDGTNPAVNQMAVDSDKAAKTLGTGHNPAGANVTLRLSELGAMTPDGVYNVSNNSKPGNIGVILSTRSATPGDTTQTQRVTSVAGAANVTAMDMSLHDASGNAYTNSNPLPVSIEESSGTEVHDYATSAALAAGATANHDYTITALKTFKLRQVWAAASGKLKITVQTSPDGSAFTTKWVGFNSTANPNIELTLPVAAPLSDSGTGSKIRVILQNNDNQAMDVYSTISGIEE